jgi:hypothetical protein
MEPRFIVDARGQLVAEDAQAKQALSGKAGQFFLAPTGPDLMFFFRTRAAGGQSNPPRVILAGDASAFPISDLIAFLNQSRWSGRLRVHTPAGERSIYLKDGEIKGASSEDPADRLGEVIVRLGYLSRKQVDDALGQAPSVKIGRALVDKGLLQAHDLWKCVTQQLSDIFHSIVLCREGAFLLIDQEFEEKSIQLVQVSTQNLLMDSIRKIDEMAHFRKRIPNPRVHVTKRRGSDGKLEKEEDRVLALVDGERTVLEVGQAAKLSEFDVTKIIFRLLEGGYVGVSERPHVRVPPEKLGVAAAVAAPAAAAAKPPASSQAPFAVIRIFNFIFREIRDEVAKKKMETEFIASANAALARRALSASPVLAGLSFDKDGNLPEQKLLKLFEDSRAQLGSEPVASLKQALSDVMFFLLFQAGELLESRADEDLARRVKELLATIEAEF